LRLRRLDVRRGYASPLRLPFNAAALPLVRALPQVFGPKVERGAQPQWRKDLLGKAEPCLTSGRRSRWEPTFCARL